MIALIRHMAVIVKSDIISILKYTAREGRQIVTQLSVEGIFMIFLFFFFFLNEVMYGH